MKWIEQNNRLGILSYMKYLHEVLSQSFLLYITVTVLAGQAEIADWREIIILMRSLQTKYLAGALPHSLPHVR